MYIPTHTLSSLAITYTSQDSETDSRITSAGELMHFCTNGVLAGFSHTHPLTKVVIDLPLFSSLFQCCGTQMYFLVVIDTVMLSDLYLGIHWVFELFSHVHTG